MSLTYNGKILAEFRVEGISGVPGAGFFRLRFHTSYRVPGHPDPWYELNSVHADIGIRVAGQQPLLLGHANPFRPITIRTITTNQEGRADFCLDILATHIRHLEETRAGGDLGFEITICGTAISNSGERGRPYPADDTIGFTANQKTWTDVLRSIGYANYLLFEIAVPPGQFDERLRVAVDELVNARENYLAGRYGDAVGTCRKVLENLTLGLGHHGLQTAAMKAFRSGKKQADLTKQERELVLREAAKLVTHPAVHGSLAPTDFTRDDAALMITVCSALLSHDLPTRVER